MSLGLKDLIHLFCVEDSLLIPFLESSTVFELVGTKWILQVPFEKFTAKHLDHARDEISHGLLLKEEIWKMREKLSVEDMIKERKYSRQFIKITEMYMTKLLTRFYKLLLKNGIARDEAIMTGYVYASYLIEMRILKGYPLIIKYCSNTSLQSVIKGILKDEHKHIAIVHSFWDEAKKSENLKYEEFEAIEEGIAQEMYNEFLKVTYEKDQNLPSHTWT